MNTLRYSLINISLRSTLASVWGANSRPRETAGRYTPPGRTPPLPRRGPGARVGQRPREEQEGSGRTSQPDRRADQRTE